MPIDVNHTCTNCSDECIKDECYCLGCREAFEQDAFDRGYEQAEKMFRPKSLINP